MELQASGSKKKGKRIEIVMYLCRQILEVMIPVLKVLRLNTKIESFRVVLHLKYQCNLRYI